jgi:excisionase family DNA binding protein
MDRDQTSELLTPSEVARMLRVNPKTVTRWAKAGKLPAIKTMGGHRRFRRDDVERAVAEAGGIYAEGNG